MKNVYFINAHPDDLNAGLGLALILAELPGYYRIHVVDLTRGERGLLQQNVSLEECAAIRTEEETDVCAGLGVTPVFLNQIDGASYAAEDTCSMLAELFRKNPPDVIITHFPADVHVDHLMCTAVAMRALKMAEMNPEIYFYRQNKQVRCMTPDRYIAFDERIMDRKCELLKLYVCQDGAEIAGRERIEDRFNGFRCEVPFAECYASFQTRLAGKEVFFDELEKIRSNKK